MNPINKKWKLFENENNIIYNAIVLNDISKKILIRAFSPKHPNTFYHHVTLNFGKKQYPENIGETVSFNVIGYAEDARCQAVVVDVPTSNKISHITLSCEDDVKPVESNKLLQNGFKKVKPIKLTGIVKSYTKSGWVSDTLQ